MKTKKLSLVAIGLLIGSLAWGQIQQKSWYLFKPYSTGATATNINFTPGASTGSNVFPLPNSPALTTYRGSNAAVDEDGRLVFYVVSTDQNVFIYDKNNTLVKTIQEGGNKEIPIIQVSCNLYHIVINGSIYEYDVSTNLAFDITNLPYTFPNGYPLGNVNIYSGGTSQKRNVYAAVKHDANSYFLYYLSSNATGGNGNRNIVKAEVNYALGTADYFQNSANISNYVINSSTYVTSFNWYVSEIEVSPNKNFLAFADDRYIFVYNLLSNGDIGSLRGYYEFESASSPIDYKVAGLEFDATNSKLVFSRFDNTGATTNDAIGIIDLINPGQPINYNFSSGTANYAKSEIELGRDNNLYITSPTAIAKINIPVSGSPSVTDIVSTTIFLNNDISGSTFNNSVRVMPDQVDGYDNSTGTGYDVSTANFDGVYSWTQTANPINSSASVIRVQNELRFAKSTSGPATNYTLTNMILEFGPDAKLTIENGVTLNLVNTQLRGAMCNKMWGGIQMQDGAKLTMTNTSNSANDGNSAIHDAHFAIAAGTDITKSYSNIQLNVQYSLFTGNFKDMQLVNTSGGTSVVIQNNQFTSAPLKDQSGDWGVLNSSYPGKYCDKTGIDISYRLASPPSSMTNIDNNNNFQGLVYGVTIYSIPVTVSHNSFMSMNPLSNVCINVNSGGSKAVVTADHNSFLGVGRAMLVYNKATASFTDNTVRITSNNAVEMIYNRDCRLTISNNTFIYCKQNAIYLSNNMGTPNIPWLPTLNLNQSSITIENNNINDVFDFTATGITLSEDGFPAVKGNASYQLLKVDNNTMNNIAYGIKTFNVAGNQDKDSKPKTPQSGDIYDNTINYFATVTSKKLLSDYNTGIQLNSSRGLKIYGYLNGQTISTSYPMNQSWRNCGIQSLLTMSTLIKQNTMKAGRGLSAMHESYDNNYLCNTFNQNYYGISMGDHYLRYPGDAHGLEKTRKESRDNSFVRPMPTKDDFELYIPYPSPSKQQVQNMIDCNQWIFLTSPSLYMDPDPNSYGIVPSHKTFLGYIAYNNSGAINPCYEGGSGSDSSSLIENGPPDVSAFNDDLNYWLWQLEFEREQKMNGLVTNAFLSSLIDLQEEMGIGDYVNAQNLISNMTATNPFGQNYLSIYQILLSSRVPQVIPLTQDQINTLTAIASANVRDAGPALYLARGILWHETGAQFYEPVDRNPPVIFEVKYDPCFEFLPQDLQIFLVDNQNHVYTDIPVLIDSPNYAFVPGNFVKALDPNLKYSFILNYDHSPVEFKSVSTWLNDDSYMVYLCNQETAKRSMLVPKEIIQKNQDMNASPVTSVVVFPNPAQGNINISSGKEIKVYMYNMLGEEMMHQNCSGNCSLNTQLFNEGVYILKIYDHQNNLIEAKKISLIK